MPAVKIQSTINNFAQSAPFSNSIPELMPNKVKNNFVFITQK